ncbi:hemerythrin domain-containing protein [Diaphorobacter limosus]|uniref:Hemerythrin domain-containing protein n=1 Tax=Diaphorobacter limosus TaxID=3036128 RepID=A0ABZ0J285_9BURK|nr:hemerythrin domain-containing protein [Diaphorobacter sp. Y-1]MBP7325195.1 hemerythrin [Alicycliphilus sp.]WOO31024.1 hemerythrin domain-containing protein [Diaphorobacter sp. Y-1]HRM49509.1 hemerythrin domain-containing protein [Alicycliphilus sp.]
MTTLQWSEDMGVEMAQMDATHQECVALLQAVQGADDARLMAAWERLLAHTEAHFAEEDRWMQATRFAAGNCHSQQHQQVLNIMRDGTERARKGRLVELRLMAAELAVWLPQHIDAMDAGLAHHLRQVGYDPATGHIAHPEALPHEPLQGWGGASGLGEGDAPVAGQVAGCSDKKMGCNA